MNMLYTLCADAKEVLFIFVCSLHKSRQIRAAQVLIVCNYRNSVTAGSYCVTHNLFCSCFFFSSLTVLKVFNASYVCRDLWVSLQQSGLVGSLWPQQHSAGWGPDVRADWCFDGGKTTEAQVHEASSVWVLYVLSHSAWTQTCSLTVTTPDLCSTGLS